MYLSEYRLRPNDVQALRLTDTYSLHREVYKLFEDVRGGNAQEHSGILFADLGRREGLRRLLILSDRLPGLPPCGTVASRELPSAWLEAEAYRFHIVINPVRRQRVSRRLEPVRGREAVAEWFQSKAPGWGFALAGAIDVRSLEVDRFRKKDKEGKEHTVTLARAAIQGLLRVTDRASFVRSVERGLGRGRAFGCGLLQVVPLSLEA